MTSSNLISSKISIKFHGVFVKYFPFGVRSSGWVLRAQISHDVSLLKKMFSLVMWIVTKALKAGVLSDISYEISTCKTLTRESSNEVGCKFSFGAHVFWLAGGIIVFNLFDISASQITAPKILVARNHDLWGATYLNITIPEICVSQSTQLILLLVEPWEVCLILGLNINIITKLTLTLFTSRILFRSLFFLFSNFLLAFGFFFQFFWLVIRQ